MNSNLIYNGLWFNPATDALKAYLAQTQAVVNGTAKVKLYKGSAKVVARNLQIPFMTKIWQPIPVQIPLIKMRQSVSSSFGIANQGQCGNS